MDKKHKKDPPPDLSQAKVKGEDEMDLIEEQAKKNPYSKVKSPKGGKSHLIPQETKYYKDDDGFVMFPDGSRYKGGMF